MSARINTILILGAAGGIGEAVARRFYTMGKKVIAAARESERPVLEQLARDLAGLEIRVWDLTELESTSGQVESILEAFPSLDTVFINAGIQNHYMIFEQAPDQKEIIRELTTNLTAPILVAHHFAQHLSELAVHGTKTNLFLTSSSLAYFPVPFYPIYSPSKSGIAVFAKVLRSQLAYTECKDMNIVEVVPPYVDTRLNAAHRKQTDDLQGGAEKAVQPMPLQEYVDAFFSELEQTKVDGSFKDEIGVGFGAQGAAVWHEGFEKLLNGSGMHD